ncbi:MAG: cysteine desulfurase [Clostridia bacterium]|nr:cysteine desulfurase [Clostridia bacterium]
MNNEIYLDNAASTKPYDEVVERMTEVLKYHYGNASSVHKKGIEAGRIIKSAAVTIAGILNCDPNEIVFTSGGAESNNLAVKGVYEANKGRGSHIITSSYEHPTVLNVVKNMSHNGNMNDILPINSDKTADLNELKDMIKQNTILVSLMHVNSETGAIADIEMASEITREKNSLTIFHSDNVQGFCKIPVDLFKMQNIDLMSISAHKIKGPKGIGALYVRKNTNICCLIDGNRHTNSLRAGTMNTPAIAGFEVAAAMTHRFMKINSEKVSQLKKYLIVNLMSQIDDVLINSPEQSSPYILNVSFKGIKSEVLLNHLSSKEIFVSAGSACSSKKNSYSHVLKAMHVPDDYIGGAIRISFNQDNTQEEIDCLIKEIKEIIPILRMVRRK